MGKQAAFLGIDHISKEYDQSLHIEGGKNVGFI